MFLCQNDMVLWNIDDPELKIKRHDSLGQPIYRVQKIDQSGTIVFRHFSVTATSDSDDWGIIRCSLNSMSFIKETVDKLTGECTKNTYPTLRFCKIDIDPLGRYTVKKDD